MKLRLMDILVCPTCHEPFDLQVMDSETLDYGDEWKRRVLGLAARDGHADGKSAERIWKTYTTEIVTGDLTCLACDQTYPIERGVPRILPPDLRTESGCMGRGDPRKDLRLQEFSDQAEPINEYEKKSLFNEVQMANQSNYGYEWKAFSHEYCGWRKVYEEYYVREDDAFFCGKLGLDAGCGMGRYSLVAVEKGAEVVGLDLSNAIDAAYEKSRAVPTFHAVQGDIFSMPVRACFFDFAQTLGVIHITPDPEEALLSIKRAVKPCGKVFLYVYPDFREENLVKYYLLKVINPVRRLTVKLPSNCLYVGLYALLPIVLLLLYFPTRVMWIVPGLRRWCRLFPYSYAQYRGRRIRDIHMNLFDRFGNPLERRYNRTQMEEWMSKADWREYQLEFRDGWTVAAVK